MADAENRNIASSLAPEFARSLQEENELLYGKLSNLRGQNRA
jgi:hypothetical protein